MKLVLFTIVLDGMPWITHHLPAFNRLKIDWHWHVMEGVSAPRHCTSWCKELPARLSIDGTSQYLEEIDHHPRVTVHRKPKWDGKVEMVNVPMASITGECILMQIDSDELWQAWQIEHLVRMFERTPLVNTAQFTCRYFVGHDIAVLGRGAYGNKDDEWIRAWRVRKGMRFEKHEPPMLLGVTPALLPVGRTQPAGLVFDHYAYATRAQVKFKEQFYGYPDAVKHWERLQANTHWPARLRAFFPWVTDDALVEHLP